MKKSLTFALIIGLTLCGPVFGRLQSSAVQQGESQKEDDSKGAVVKLGVTLVQVDAVVTDKKGRQVRDLRPEDFEIYEDGRRQQITNFSYVSTSAEDAPSEVIPPPSVKSAAPVPPVNLRPEQVRRTIALVVDDLTLSFESAHSVREALKKFVTEQMKPGDLVAILRTGAGVGALQQFTSDKRQLYAAIERVRWYPGGRGRIGAFAQIVEDQTDASIKLGRGRASASDTPDGQDPLTRDSSRRDEHRGDRERDDELEKFRENIFAVGTLGALNFIVRGLRGLPGRKSVMLFSDGFRLFNREGDNYRVLESLRRLTDLANRASVVVYTMDARGLQVTGLTAADDVSSLRPDEIEERLRNRRDELFETQEGLNYLAQETGGLALRNSNDLSLGIKRALDDQKGYYLLGYVPDEKTFKAESGRHRFHKISIKVKPSGYNVRSRRGFYGITDEEARPTHLTREAQLYAAVTSPFSSGELDLRLTSLFGQDPNKGAYVRSLLYIDMHGFTFVEEANGKRKATFDILAVTFGDNGQPVDEEGRTYVLEVSTEEMQSILSTGILYTLLVPIKKPGAYQLRAAVRDVATERVGSANQYIEVPDMGKKRLGISGIVLSEYDVPAQQATGDTDDVNDRVASQLTPALRRFQSGRNVKYSFYIYNAKQDQATHLPQLETQVMLFKDGKPVYTGKSNPVNLNGKIDTRQIPAYGVLQLAGRMQPGEYVLQIIVKDRLAKEKYSVASQWIDIEVVE